MRLDTLVSAAFGISRDKAVERIQSGDVSVNWDIVTKPNLSVENGDVISCRHKGRAEITNVEFTQKMKYRVSFTRFS